MLIIKRKNSNTIKSDALHKHILLRIIKQGMEWRKCPIWLEIWYQVSQLRPWNLDIVPWWLSHARLYAGCTVQCYDLSSSFQVLLDRYGLTSMEDVFLRLSTDDDASERIKSKASSISYLDNNWGSYPRWINLIRVNSKMTRLSLEALNLDC